MTNKDLKKYFDEIRTVKDLAAWSVEMYLSGDLDEDEMLRGTDLFPWSFPDIWARVDVDEVQGEYVVVDWYGWRARWRDRESAWTVLEPSFELQELAHVINNRAEFLAAIIEANEAISTSFAAWIHSRSEDRNIDQMTVRELIDQIIAWRRWSNRTRNQDKRREQDIRAQVSRAELPAR